MSLGEPEAALVVLQKALNNRESLLGPCNVATLETPPSDAFYGERSGVIRDPFGHRWNIGHHIEDVSTDEMQRRYTRMLAAQP